MHLQWYLISKHAHNGHLLGYTIYYYSSCYHHGGRENVSDSTTSYTLSGLRKGARYEIRIAGYTEAGIGQESYREIFTCKNCNNAENMANLNEIKAAFTLDARAGCLSMIWYSMGTNVNKPFLFSISQFKLEFEHGVVGRPCTRALCRHRVSVSTHFLSRFLGNQLLCLPITDFLLRSRLKMAPDTGWNGANMYIVTYWVTKV